MTKRTENRAATADTRRHPHTRYTDTNTHPLQLQLHATLTHQSELSLYSSVKCLRRRLHTPSLPVVRARERRAEYSPRGRAHIPCLSHPALRNKILGEAFRRPANGGSTRHAPAPRAGNCGGCPWGLSSRSCTGGAAVSCRDPGPRSTTRCRGAGRPVRPCRKPRTS